MRKKSILLLAALFCAVVALAGCGGCGGRIESWHCIAVAVILMGLVVGIMLFKKKRV